MNDPKDQPIDIEDQKAWLIEHKKANHGLSWGQLSQRTGINRSSLSLFVTGNYNAPGDKIAEAIFRYRQTLSSQQALKAEGPQIPGYYETATSKELIYRLRWAQRGRIVVAALGAGISKSMTAEHYQACNANVFLVTLAPSSSGLRNLQKAVLRALGDRTASGDADALSYSIMERVRPLQSPLLILDEAQHLTVKSIEEVRSWHDKTGMGIALFGNESIQQQLDGGMRSAAYAQIFSRVSLNLVRSFPLAADVDAMLEAWNVSEEGVCAEVHRIAQYPGALRGATFALELAHMIASGQNEDLALRHVQDAWVQLSTRAVAA